MLELLWRLMLVSMGVEVLIKKKIEGIVRKLIKQGEISKEEEMKLLKKILQKRGKRGKKH